MKTVISRRAIVYGALVLIVLVLIYVAFLWARRPVRAKRHKKDEPQIVKLIARLDVLSAKASNRTENGWTYIVTLQATRINQQPLPAPPERVRVMIAFAAGRPPADRLRELLNVAEWEWQTSSRSSAFSGAPEIDGATWLRERSYCRLPDSLGDAGQKEAAFCFLEATRPTDKISWDLDKNPVLMFAIDAFDEDHPRPAQPGGLAAICLCGLKAINRLVRLSDPVVVVLDPEKPDVSVTKRTVAPLPPERIRELRVLADKAPGLLRTSDMAGYKASFGPHVQHDKAKETTNAFRAMRLSAGTVISDTDAFKDLLAQEWVMSLTFVVLPGRGPDLDAITKALGEPDKKEGGIVKREMQSDFGFTEEKRLQVDWYHWAWTSLAVEKGTKECCELRINTAQRRTILSR